MEQQEQPELSKEEARRIAEELLARQAADPNARAFQAQLDAERQASLTPEERQAEADRRRKRLDESRAAADAAKRLDAMTPAQAASEAQAMGIKSPFLTAEAMEKKNRGGWWDLLVLLLVLAGIGLVVAAGVGH